MKNSLTRPILLGSIFGLTVTAGVAYASVNDLKFYAGAGLDYSKYGFNSEFKNKVTQGGLGMLAPILGIRFCDNFGLEAGYAFKKKIKSKDDASHSFKVNNAYVDLIGFMPMTNQADFIAGLGAGRLMVKKNANLPSELVVKNKFNWRIKLGTQYNINNNLWARAVFSYQNAGTKLKFAGKEKKFIKNMKSLDLSVIWTF